MEGGRGGKLGKKFGSVMMKAMDNLVPGALFSLTGGRKTRALRATILK